MKSLLVPVERHGQMRATLATACLLARRCGSLIEGLALRPAFLPPLGIEPASAIVLQGADEEDGAAQEEARAEFLAALRENGVPLSEGAPPAGPAGVWNAEAGADDDFLGRHARAFDLTIVGRPDAKGGGPRMTTLEAALFDSGRPILIAPPQAPATIATRIAIAWNGSTETARAISCALPLLKRAESVFVLAGEDTRPGPSGPQIVRHLSLNGVASELRRMEPAAIRSGDAILDQARALSCDLLVKGAYTQSRLRQMIFGGATSSIIARTTLPVLMAH
ncbi:universal stress protein [Aureimonas populi]|uniref:Universal stress protein n=1 Tax=Aureimonas populi TaxID=1701758 RepID=A0ABW5CRA8_9HYPH|nr:universal stress protein [Aureimonas populi]